MAVKITNGAKYFQEKNCLSKTSNYITVLQNFYLNVPTGSLYSLLGSSGCGKTTVISIIMGICKLDRGNLEVPRSSRALGYMPQETCLYSEFSIFETLHYFGTLFGISNDLDNNKEYLKARIESLRKLLLLPPENRIVGTLSGGQKRRLSLAVALVHEPDILLLDEPTAGLDPLVRELIWDYLSTLTRTRGTTVILTTHNVDEAQRSSLVGFMRYGQLIAEDTPYNLFQKFGVNSMESVFLALCQQETLQNAKFLRVNYAQRLTSSEKVDTLKRAVDPNGTIRRIHALVGKNYKCAFRDIWVVLFVIAMPALCMLFSCIGFQHDPHSIAFGVVNEDANHSFTTGIGCVKNDSIKDYCRTEKLSCGLLESLEGNTIQLKSYHTTGSAIEAVEIGNIWGYLHFARNYSDAITNRMIMGSSSFYDETDAGKAEWNDSQITVRLDQTNTLIYGTIIAALYTAFENSSKTLLKSCGYDERIAQYPLQYMDPIVGTTDMAQIKYIGPGLAIELIYFFSLATAGRFITEKREGTLKRCIAGGAKYWEILASYAITQTSVLVFQCILIILVLYFGVSVFTYLSNVPLIFFSLFATRS